MRKRRWPILIIYVIALAVCAVLIYIVPSVLGLFDATYVAKHGSIEVSTSVEAYVFRNDKVYTADAAGTVNRLVPEGSLVKGKSRIVELSGDGRDGIENKYEDILTQLGPGGTTIAPNGVADKSGYVSYQIDGLENVFSVRNIDNVNRSTAQAMDGYRPMEVQSGRCAVGEPVFRIAGNGNWHLLFWLNNSEPIPFDEGDYVTLVIDGERLDGRIVTVKVGNEITRVEASTNTFHTKLMNDRKIEFDIVTAEADGIILRSNSIIEKDGVKGVLVRDKVGDNQFKPVRIKADNGKEAAVYSDFFMDDNMQFVETVKTYDEVVSNPTEEDIAAAVDVNDKYK